MRSCLLVTNDYPPKVGGIQSYLWELWRRLPPEDASVYCTPHSGSIAFDAAADYHIERSPEPFLVPYPWLASRIDRIAQDVGAELVLLDPALPLGHIGPSLSRPYGVVLHGAEVTIPARLPGTRKLLSRTLEGASLVVSAGHYALREAQACVAGTLPAVVVPPGVDTERFRPVSEEAKAGLRSSFGLTPEHLVISSVNRLVPRKGLDRLVRSAARLRHRFPQLQVLIGGTGRESDRLRRLVEATAAPVTLLGRVCDEDVARIYQTSDCMAMLCHDRWNGLEQEGFGIAFLEAAACGIPQLASQSGGAAEAVVDGETGLVLPASATSDQLDSALASLLSDAAARQRLGAKARQRVLGHFDYDLLATELERGIDSALDQEVSNTTTLYRGEENV